ncbi:MAG: MobF family relaxase [Acidobacteriaceae bacterium]
MLSIKALKGATRADAGGIADYPREDGVDSPEDARGSAGVEDYYAQGGQGAPSQWLGTGASALGLHGPVSREAQIAVLMGEHSTTGEVLGQQRLEHRRMGEDLTFSAPKAVSVAWAAGDPDLRRAIEIAQDAAVARTLQHIEQRLSLGRRGKGGAERESVNLVAAAYRHGSSRERDPQIHTHLLVSNLAQRADGSWGAIENSQLLRNKLALGALYRAELAAALREMGFQIERDGDSFKLSAISDSTCTEFSRRREQIEAAMQAHGTHGARAAEVAALSTRQSKEITDTDTLRTDWKTRAAAHGITADSLDAARHHQAGQQPEQPIYDRSEVLSALTHGESTFSEPAIWREVAVAAQGTGMNADAIEREVRYLMHDRELVRLHAKLREPEIDERTGKPKQQKPAEPRWTTKDMFALEREMASMAEAAQGDTSHALSPAQVDTALAQFAQEKGFNLYDEQAAAVRHACQTPGSVKIVKGEAGTGKTTLAAAARLAFESAGFRVRGAALAGKASRGLQNDSQIKSGTLASLLRSIQPGEDGKDPLTSKDVIVIDEAAMLGSRQTHQLIKLCQESGAKLIMVGDQDQLQAIEAGGAFNALLDRVGGATLQENRRQKTEDMRQVVDHAHRGEAGQAFKVLAERGMVAVEADRTAAIAETVRRWAGRLEATGKADQVMMIASTKAAVADLNEAALKHQKAAGVLGPGAEIKVRDRQGKSFGNREFLEGGRVCFKKKDKDLDIENGELGTIQRVDVDSQGRPTISIKLDRGQVVTIMPEHEHPGRGRPAPGVGYASLEHGWAGTTHVAQGATIDAAIVFADGSMASREQLYVMLSRMRYSTDLVFSAGDLEKDEDQLAPTEAMVDFAKFVSEKDGVELGDGEDLESFGACRAWLNEHAPERIENRPDDLKRLKDIAEAMSRSHAKDTTLDYQVDEQTQTADQHQPMDEDDGDGESE